MSIHNVDSQEKQSAISIKYFVSCFLTIIKFLEKIRKRSFFNFTRSAVIVKSEIDAEVEGL